MYNLLACTQFQAAFLYVYEPNFKVNVTCKLVKDLRTENKIHGQFLDK
jgi:hypothetical protein